MPDKTYTSDKEWIKELLTYEHEHGDGDGTPHFNYGYNSKRNAPKFKNIDEAVDFFVKNDLPFMKEQYPDDIMERAKASDFIFNTGKDPKIYAVNQYLNDNKDSTDKSDLDYLNEKDSKTGDSKRIRIKDAMADGVVGFEYGDPADAAKINSLYDKYVKELSSGERVINLDDSRNYYYQNTNVGSGSFKATWEGRTNLYGGYVGDKTEGRTATEKPVTEKPKAVTQYEDGTRIGVSDLMNISDWYDEAKKNNLDLNNPDSYKDAPESVKRIYKETIDKKAEGGADTEDPKTVFDLTAPGSGADVPIEKKMLDKDTVPKKEADIEKKAASPPMKNFDLTAPGSGADVPIEKKMLPKDDSGTNKYLTNPNQSKSSTDMNDQELSALYDKYNKDPKSLTEQEIKQLQSFLGSQGFDIGFDKQGEFGEDTQEAFKKYSLERSKDGISTTKENIKKSSSDEVNKYDNAKKSEDALKNKIKYAAADAYNVAKAGVDTFRFANSLNQIRKGAKAREALEGKKPKLGAPQTSGALKESLQESGARAQRGFSNQTIGVMADQDMSAYTNAIMNAKAQGGGQSGMTGQGEAFAYNKLLQANLKRGVENENANATNFAQHTALLGHDVNEKNHIRSIGFQDYQKRLGDHNRRLGEASELERIGRVNRDNSMSTFSNTAANLARTYYKRREQRGDIPLEGTPERDAYDLNVEKEKQLKIDNRANRRTQSRDEALGRKNNRQFSRDNKQELRQLNKMARLDKLKQIQQAERDRVALQKQGNNNPNFNNTNTPYNGLNLDEIYGTQTPFKR